MKISQEELKDKLLRAYEAEQMKCDMLNSLCNSEDLAEVFDVEVRDEVELILKSIYEDTESHKVMLSSILKNLS